MNGISIALKRMRNNVLYLVSVATDVGGWVAGPELEGGVVER